MFSPLEIADSRVAGIRIVSIIRCPGIREYTYEFQRGYALVYVGAAGAPPAPKASRRRRRGPAGAAYDQRDA